MPLKDSPPALLLVTGGLLGLTFPLAKLASEASISPIIWAWLIAAGSGTVLFLIQLSLNNKLLVQRNYLVYYLISAIFSLVLPNVLIFTVIPILGSGFTGVLFTLSPIFTLTLSSIWQVRMPSKLGIAGILLGFVGAVIVALTRGEIDQPASILWVLTALLIPVSLAVGNIHRSLAWPEDAQPMQLAIGSNLAAALLLFILAIANSQVTEFVALLSVKKLIVVQVIGSAAMFSVLYRLQQVGGPTYLSQIGYVAAAVALFTGTLFLDERYSILTWFGAMVIVCGILLNVVAHQRNYP